MVSRMIPNEVDLPTECAIERVLETNECSTVELCMHIKTRLSNGQQFTVTECTALLAALDIAGSSLAQRFDLANGSFFESLKPMAHGLPLYRTYDSLMRELGNVEHHAQLVRTARRNTVTRELQRFEQANSQTEISAFVQSVVWPLLCRKWVPMMWHEPGPIPEWHKTSVVSKWESLWVDPGVSIEDLTDYCSVSKERRIDRLMTSLRIQPVTVYTEKTAQYLRAASDVSGAYGWTRSGPVRVPVLFAPFHDEWPLGHLLDVIVVPFQLEVTSDLVSQSLVPARAAARDILGKDPLAPTYQWGLTAGDYPGGTTFPAPLCGPSAGFALAVGLVIGLAGLKLREASFLVGRIRPNGNLQSLDGAALGGLPEQLKAKGRALALTAGTRKPTFVVGCHEDGGWLSAGARPFGTCAEAITVDCLGTAIGVTTDLYDGIGKSTKVVEEEPKPMGQERAARALVRRILDNSKTDRWVFTLHGHRNEEETLGRAMEMEMARLLNSSSPCEFRGIYLSTRELARAVSGSVSLSEHVAKQLLLMAVDRTQELARKACVASDLKNGRIAVFVDLPGDYLSGVSSSNQITIARVIRLCAELLHYVGDTEVRRVVILDYGSVWSDNSVAFTEYRFENELFDRNAS